MKDCAASMQYIKRAIDLDVVDRIVRLVREFDAGMWY